VVRGVSQQRSPKHMAEDTKASVSVIRTFFRDFPLGFLMAPLLFSWVGTVAMGAGFEFGRRGRAQGPELFPSFLGSQLS